MIVHTTEVVAAEEPNHEQGEAREDECHTPDETSHRSEELAIAPRPRHGLVFGVLCVVLGTLACEGATPSGVSRATSAPESGAGPTGGASNAGAGAVAGGAGSVGAGGGSGSDLTGYCAVWASRLRECGLVGPGRYTGCTNYSDAAEICEQACVASAACADIEDYYCGPGDVLGACLGSCVGEMPVSCADGTSFSYLYRCDGYEDCVGGEDETGCQGASVKCRNVDQRVDESLLCNGMPDCSDASDEPPECSATFTCGDAETLPAVFACDGFADCLDGTDEPVDCAVAMCP
jgi:hypothetical protein